MSHTNSNAFNFFIYINRLIWFIFKPTLLLYQRCCMSKQRLFIIIWKSMASSNRYSYRKLLTLTIGLSCDDYQPLSRSWCWLPTWWNEKYTRIVSSYNVYVKVANECEFISAEMTRHAIRHVALVVAAGGLVWNPGREENLTRHLCWNFVTPTMNHLQPWNLNLHLFLFECKLDFT